MSKKHIDFIWTDKKRTFLGLPISFTRYFLTDKKIICRTGFFNIAEDEINIYKITDKKLTLSLGERLFGCGTITVFSRDTDTPKMEIKHIKKPYEVSEMIDKEIDEERDKYGIRGRDMIPGHYCDHGDGDLDHDGLND
ncbi:PH domain-containing protein [Ruminococcus sp. HUN007]|uniref:PH domain-containing protein n=1 Tax=Ruminococcus sp. HUN007 TaxID=1514668 RepID=UPI0005D16C27|nr:PH domain-containing protein [Ruminococcus sp. HUN007]